MRILLDENLDWRLRRDLPGHLVEGLENGEYGRDYLVGLDKRLREAVASR